MIKSLYILIFIGISFVFADCSSVQKLQREMPIIVETAYFHKWTSGVRGGGLGLNLFIQVENNNKIDLDSVYFRGKASKLEIIENNKLYVGRFLSAFNQKPDIVMSDNQNDEYGNQTLIIPSKIPFKLKDDECVMSYKEGNDTKYFKIDNIIEKQAEHLPIDMLEKQ